MLKRARPVSLVSRSGGLKWRIHRGATHGRSRAIEPARAEASAICRVPRERGGVRGVGLGLMARGGGEGLLDARIQEGEWWA